MKIDDMDTVCEHCWHYEEKGDCKNPSLMVSDFWSSHFELCCKCNSTKQEYVDGIDLVNKLAKMKTPQ